MSVNRWLTSHFEGCTVLATGHDPHRNREVKVFAIPGEATLVGYSDGCEAFLCPANGQPFGPNGVSLQKLLESLRCGTFKGPVPGNPQRRVPIIQNETNTVARRKINV